MTGTAFSTTGVKYAEHLTPGEFILNVGRVIACGEVSKGSAFVAVEVDGFEWSLATGQPHTTRRTIIHHKADEVSVVAKGTAAKGGAAARVKAVRDAVPDDLAPEPGPLYQLRVQARWPFSADYQSRDCGHMTDWLEVTELQVAQIQRILLPELDQPARAEE